MDAPLPGKGRGEPSADTAQARRGFVRQKYDELAWVGTGLTTDELQRRLLALTDAQCAAVTKCVVALLRVSVWLALLMGGVTQAVL